MSLSQRLAAISDIIHTKRGCGGSVKNNNNNDNDNHDVHDDDYIAKRRRIVKSADNAMVIPAMRLSFFVQRTTATTTSRDLSAAAAAAAADVPVALDSDMHGDCNHSLDDSTENTNNDSSLHDTLLLPDAITKDHVQYLMEQSALVEEENQKLMSQRSEIFQTQSRIYNTYLEGLSTISQLTDLRQAPDAIMPDNF